jgi:hypothetical protein
LRVASLGGFWRLEPERAMWPLAVVVPDERAQGLVRGVNTVR